MGHVSDFNGMNGCDETDLSQVASQLISDENLLGLNLNENFMPIYNSFPDDIYRQPNFYASTNLSSFSSEVNGNGYYDEPLNLDLFFGSDNFTLDDSVPILENEETRILQSDTAADFNIDPNINERDETVANYDKESQPISDKKYNEQEKCDAKDKVIQVDPINKVKLEENNLHLSDHIESTYPGEAKTFTAETVFNSSETDVKCDPIPKLIIRLKPDLKSQEPDLCTSELSPPMTIADNVKLGRRRNGNQKVDEAEHSTSKKAKHKSHKRKSKHKKKHNSHHDGSKIKENQNFNGILQKNTSFSYTEKNSCLNQNITVNEGKSDSKTSYSFPQVENNLNNLLSNNDNFPLNKSSLFVNTDSYSCNNKQILNNCHNETVQTDSETENKTLTNQSVDIDPDDYFQFDSDDANDLPLTSIDIKEELDSSVDELLEKIEIPSVNENIPDFNNCFTEDNESVKSESSSEKELPDEIHNKEFHVEAGDNNGPIKGSSASDLIEELNAHNQQVFEEIEISTPELELELNSVRNVIDPSLEASHSSQLSANNVTEENDMNSQNHLSTNEKSPSTFSSATNHNNISRPRNISSSSSSVTSKSSTSHRSYRKRRRSSSSSSSSPEREKFYNRPVKYDPVTDTYCDEFGREIRPNELKYYLNSKSNHRDSHSNNGSSSSSLSRSKSPRYRSYYRKHHKSRSGSRSSRRWRHSSSHSRSRSRGRKHKNDSDRKYRSPSPKHRSKRQHFMDIEENMKAYEERRVMYVGDIPPDYTVEQLKDRFGRFGPIQNASIKSKFTSDGSLYIFGFVTFKNRADVCDAIERGNENPSWPRFDLNFGGRRRFCNGNYTDLDGKVAEAESGWYGHQTFYRQQPMKKEDDFAELLRQEQRRVSMSKK